MSTVTEIENHFIFDPEFWTSQVPGRTQNEVRVFWCLCWRKSLEHSWQHHLSLCIFLSCQLAPLKLSAPHLPLSSRVFKVMLPLIVTLAMAEYDVMYSPWSQTSGALYLTLIYVCYCFTLDVHFINEFHAFKHAEIRSGIGNSHAYYRPLLSLSQHHKTLFLIHDSQAIYLFCSSSAALLQHPAYPYTNVIYRNSYASRKSGKGLNVTEKITTLEF